MGFRSLFAQVLFFLGSLLSMQAAAQVQLPAAHPAYAAGPVSHFSADTATSLSHAVFTTKQPEQLNEPLFENEEEDELVSLKKQLKSGSYFIAAFFIPGPGDLAYPVKKAPAFDPFIASFHTGRYLLLEVFRI